MNEQQTRLFMNIITEEALHKKDTKSKQNTFTFDIANGI